MEWNRNGEIEREKKKQVIREKANRDRQKKGRRKCVERFEEQ